MVLKVSAIIFYASLGVLVHLLGDFDSIYVYLIVCFIGGYLIERILQLLKSS